ncbi:MAG TPA: sugar phosphate isomerase/epimerase family protein [Fimbriiglobus sp.]|jgi:sugar phosphate isomerase/epimerase
MPTLSRRAFLGTAGTWVAAPVLAIDPITRPTGKPWLRLGLAAYSFRQWLDLKKKEMTLFEFIDLAAGLPLDAVELTSYYFADTSDAYLAKLKTHATRLGLDISGVPVRNDFCTRDAGKRKADIEHVKVWTDRAVKLGAKTVRIFAGTVEKGNDRAAAIKRTISAIEECCDHAAKVGMFLALENHGGPTATPAGILEIVRGVKSDHFGINVDTGNFHTADPYADLAKIAPYGVVSQVKTEVYPGGKKEEADLKRVIGILKAASFRGYVVLEYEAAADARTVVPKYVKELRALIG